MDNDNDNNNRSDEDEAVEQLASCSCRSISLGKGTFETTNSNNILMSVTFQNTKNENTTSSMSMSMSRSIIGSANSYQYTICHGYHSGLCSKESNDTIGTIDTTISSSSTSSSTCTSTSVSTSARAGTNDNATTDTSANSIAINSPCLYIRANDLVKKLSTLESTNNVKIMSSNDNDSTCARANFEKNNLNQVFIKPHPMIHLDEDPTQLFIPLASSYTHAAQNNNNGQEQQREQEQNDQNLKTMYSSPYLSFVMDTLLENGLNFINNQQQWTYYHQSNIQTTLSNDVSFPNIDIAISVSSNNRLNTSLKLSQPIALSKHQISSLQNDVLLWMHNGNGNGDKKNNDHIPNPPNSFAIRACGIISMKPCDLYNLLLDSKRNKEYNLYSCGRNDIWTHDYDYNGSDDNNSNDNVNKCDGDDDNDDDVNGDYDLGLLGNEDCFEKKHHHKQQQQTKKCHYRITKVWHGSNKPPLVRKAIPYMSLIHGQEIETNNIDTKLPPSTICHGYHSGLCSKESNDTIGTIDTTISSSSTSSSTCTSTSVSTSARAGTNDNATTDTSANSIAINSPCLYIRANDLVKKLSTLESTNNVKIMSSNDNDSTCARANFEKNNLNQVFIKPHPMIHLDEDPTQLFIPLASSYTHAAQNNNNGQEQQREQEQNDQNLKTMYSSPYLSFVMDTLLENGLNFINNQQQWTYYHQSNIQTTLSNDVSFPNIDIAISVSSNNRLNTSLKLSQPIALSKHQISSLQNDVLLWMHNGNGNGDKKNNDHIPNPPNSFAIRACGIISMKPCDLYNLLLDSKRNKEYNLYSCGRNDIWTHDYDYNGSDDNNSNDNVNKCDGDDDNDDDVNGDYDLGLLGNEDCFEKKHHHKQQQQTKKCHYRITKVWHGSNKPPLVRKAIPYMSLIHGQEIETNNIDTKLPPSMSSLSPSKGYILSTRSAYQVDSNGVMKNSKSYATEIIIGSTLLLPISIDDNNEEGNNQNMITLFINANLVKSPLPYCITKKVGVSSAVNFVNWLRAMCN
jgi:ethanolamine utilization protein EutP (predicted NTPase)